MCEHREKTVNCGQNVVISIEQLLVFVGEGTFVCVCVCVCVCGGVGVKAAITTVDCRSSD